MNGQTETYRDILRRELAWRSCANPAYSQRAFARDIGVAPHRLSEILNCKRGLSKEAARKVAVGLKMNVRDAEYFCNLVESEHGRSHAKRQGAVARLESDDTGRTRIDPSEYEVISDYRHLAVLEMLSMKDAKSDARWLAGRLSFPVKEVSRILNQLLGAGFIQSAKARLVPVFERTFFSSATPSQAIRAFHAGLQQAGLRAIFEQPIGKRSLDALIFKVDPAAVPEIERELSHCLEKISRIAAASRKKTELYALTTNLFSLLKEQR